MNEAGTGAKPTEERRTQGLNLYYAKSIPGILKIVQMIFSFIFCFLAGIYSEGGDTYDSTFLSHSLFFPGIGWTLFVAGFTLILSAIVFTVYLLSLNETILARLPWDTIVLVYNLAAALLWFIAWAVQAAQAARAKKISRIAMASIYGIWPIYGQYIAATIFGVVIMMLYMVEAALAFMRKRSN